MNKSQFHLQAEVDRLYAQKPRQLAFHASSVEEYQAWKLSLRQKLIEILGLAGRTLPVVPRVERVQAVDRGAYVEEKYVMSVNDQTEAPLYVLVPKSGPPYKSILAFHGHSPSVQPILGNSPEGEAANNGSYARALAKAGYLVAAVEQRGFGERTSNQVGAQQNSCRHLSLEYMMQGRTMIGERCWDGMVAISYVQSRPDVVPGAVGCIGYSGGGTTTLWLSALDDRISIAVVASYLCSFKHSILAVPHCECNYVPRILEYAEMGDLATLIAPRPFRAVSGEYDPIFPIEGARQQFETVKKAYELLGVPARASLAVHPGKHDYHHGLCQEWFAQWL
jgi:pimeloyl-ACP methyl ester carboxylesterase